MFRYPRTNFHELNLDWILRKIESGNVDIGCAFVRPEEFPESSNPVQDAMDFAAENNKMVLLSKAYNIYETLIPADGVQVYGIFNATLISHAQDETVGFAPITLIDCPNDFLIENVTFDGNRPEGASQSTYPTAPGNENATVKIAPLISAYSKNNIYFNRCKWTNYDSNRSTSIGSYHYAALGCYDCTNVTVNNCSFVDIWRECTVFASCEYVTIEDSYFNMGDSSNVYTEIGLGQTNHVKILNCRIVKSDTVITSAINAMGNYIEIVGCNIRAISSTYGIDYGNEVSATFTATDLTIRNCYLNCHISGATTYDINHNNVKIINNTFDATGVNGTSGLIMVYGSDGNAFEIINNHFIGTFAAPVLHAIRTGQNPNLIVSIIGNTFEAAAIRISEEFPQMIIANNLFKNDAIYQSTANDTAQTLVFNGCTCTRVGRFGALGSGNQITIHLVGCDFKRSVCTNALAVDASLSYIRGV